MSEDIGGDLGDITSMLTQNLDNLINDFNSSHDNMKIVKVGKSHKLVILDVMKYISKPFADVGLNPEISVIDDAIIIRFEKKDLIRMVTSRVGQADLSRVIKGYDIERQPDGTFNFVAILTF